MRFIKETIYIFSVMAAGGIAFWAAAPVIAQIIWIISK